MSDPERVQATGVIHQLSWWQRLLHGITPEPRWQPGYEYLPYRYAGGRGHWLVNTNGEDVWATSDIEFDRQYWLRGGFRPPHRFTEVEGIPDLTGNPDIGDYLRKRGEARR